MANTTFNGPVRSENGFETISKNAYYWCNNRLHSGNKMSAEAVWKC